MIFLAFFAISISVVSVFMPSLLTSHVDEDSIGAVMGMYEGIGSLGRILGPLIAYSVPLYLIRYQYFYYGIFLLAILVCFILLRQKIVMKTMSKKD